MRITQSMLSNNMLTNISNSYEKLAKLQNQITTQKKFSKPSDDPSAAMMGMTYRTSLNEVQQFSSNISDATNWTESTDSALNQAVSALQRIRELATQASNGTYDANQRESIAAEIKQLKQHLTDIGDTQLGGKYIFNGYDTNKRPSDTITNGAPTYSSGNIQIEVFNGIKVQINTSGKVFSDALQNGGSIDKLDSALSNANTDQSTITNLIGDIDTTIDSFLKVQSEVGAKQNRIDLMKDRLSNQEVSAQKILSDNEDVDMEKVILDFTTQQSVHNAALSVGSKIIQPSLLDFLR